jgi:hypothetical protein
MICAIDDNGRGAFLGGWERPGFEKWGRMGTMERRENDDCLDTQGIHVDMFGGLYRCIGVGQYNAEAHTHYPFILNYQPW